MKITSIEEVTNYKFKNNWYRYNGFRVKTDTDELLFLIQNDQACCEIWGTYLYTPEKIQDYIGSEYLGFDTDVKKSVAKKLMKDEKVEIELKEINFLNIHTSKGTIDFAVYNSHNGYYAHETLLVIMNKKENVKSKIKTWL